MTRIERTVLAAVAAHEGELSRNLFRAFLVGDECALITEKGLAVSPFFGALRGETENAVGEAIEALLAAGALGVYATWHRELVVLK